MPTPPPRSDSSGPRRPPDAAANPVVAGLLMVAVTAVLAAAVYVSTSGFTAGTAQAPAATFSIETCTPSEDKVQIQLHSRGPVQKDDVDLNLFNRTDDTLEAHTDPLLADGGPWGTGEVVAVDTDGSSDPTWNGSLDSPGGLGSGYNYRVDFVHGPTESVFSQAPFTC